MGAITLRNLPPHLRRRLEEESSATGASLNKTVIRLLLRATGLAHSSREHRFHDLDYLAGSWNDREAKEFEKSLAAQRRVDLELWD